MDINTLTSTYFVGSGDVSGAGEVVPNTTVGNLITPLIDGDAYFGAIIRELRKLGNSPKDQFFYTTGWWLHLIDGPGKQTTNVPAVPATVASKTLGGGPATKDGFKVKAFPLLLDLLTQKAEQGVDVRIMAWVNPLVLTARGMQSSGYWDIVASNLLSIDALRKSHGASSTPLEKRVCALTIGHLLGAFHMKMTLLSDGTVPLAFLGGMDFVINRIARQMHTDPNQTWHDGGVAVDGPAFQALYNHFRSIWNEQLNRPVDEMDVGGNIIKSVVPNTLDIPARTFSQTGSGKLHVQVTRTLPQFHVSLPFGTPEVIKRRTTPLSFAQDGVFEVKVAWRKAIANASQYIYIEDQAFWSQEVMDFVNGRISKVDGLKVILLTGAPDPNDPPSSNPEMVEAMNNHLLKGLNDPQKKRIGVFRRKNIIVHTKATIIDDHWMIIGSANCMRRSLYTDGELSVAFIDETDGQIFDVDPTRVWLPKQFRVDLWGEHFGKNPGADREPLKDLDKALAVWDPSFGSSPAVPFPSALLDKVPLPMPSAPFNSATYQFSDWDSRDTLDVGKAP